jgi:hypothetical protein
MQAAAAAAGGFVAGAAVVRLVGRRHRQPARAGRRLLTRRSQRPGGIERLHVVATRSLLLDVHLLGTPSPDR